MAFTANLTADGATATFVIPREARVHLTGSFGGGTLTLQGNSSGTFEDLVGTAQTAAADFIFDSVGEGTFQFDLAGATTPDIDITVIIQ